MKIITPDRDLGKQSVFEANIPETDAPAFWDVETE